jgi:ribosomal protein S10
METQTLHQKILLLSNDQKLKLEAYINYLLEAAEQEEVRKKGPVSEDKKIIKPFNLRPLL